MQTPTVDLFWALLIASLVGFFLAATVVSIILFSQRRYKLAQRQKLQEVRESEQKYRDIFNFAPVGIYKVSLDGAFLDVNMALVEMLGYSSAGELMSRNIEKDVYLNKEDRRQILIQHVPGGMPYTAEVLWRKKDSTPIWVQLHGYVFKDASGDVEYIEGFVYDISVRKRTEHALKQNEERFRALIENSSDGIVVLNKEGTITYSGPSTERLLGFTPEEFVGRYAFDMVHPDDKSQMMQIFAEILHHPGMTVKAEYRVVKKDGTVAWFEGIGTNLLDDPYIKGIVANYRDITQRKNSEEALHRSEEKYRKYFQEDLSGIFISTPEGRLLDCNPRFAQILGYDTVDEVLGASTYMWYERRVDRENYIQLLREKGKLVNYERTLIRKDGKKIQVVANVAGECNEQGDLVRIRGYLFDVTERKEAEEQYRTLFEESKDVAFISTPGGKFLEINPAGIELFGYQSKDELLRLDIANDLYWNPTRRVDFQKLIRRQGFVKDFEVELRRKDAQKVVVQETTTVVRDPSGKIIGYRGILRDITNQKRLEDQLRQAQKMESIGTLAGGIAHDFNNILGIILGHISSLERNGNDEEKFKKSIEALNKAVQRGAGLVHQLLTFARKTDVQFESIDINTTLEDLVKILSETFPKTVTVSVELEENLPIIVGDHNQLHQVLLNLCVNARDAMMEPHPGQTENPALHQPGGELTLHTSVVSGVSLRGQYTEAVSDQYVRVSVGDSGVGMDEKTRTRIFEPFFTTKEKGKGTGLGLSVVYGVMKSHHGFIDVESELGKGTTFQFYFPVPQQILKMSEIKAVEESEAVGGSETILVVEDEEMLLELVKTLFEDKGYRVLTARDGQKAVEVYQERHDEIALVLSDMGLPKLSGWDAFQKMREINPNVKVILASGYLDPNVRSEMLKGGAKDFVQKPYNVNKIFRLLREIIDNSSVPVTQA